jgi:RimJ/RimL family protein N-acetyltransferase
MKVQFYDDITDFITLSFPFLLQNEAENNLIFSFLNALKENPKRFGKEAPLLISIKDNKKIKLIFVIPPPVYATFSYTDNLELIELLIEHLSKSNYKLSGVLAFKEGGKHFAEMWSKKTSLKYRVIRNERIYKLENVSEGTLGQRKFIAGSKNDESLILQWSRDFILEAAPETDEEELEKILFNIRTDIQKEKIFMLLDNNVPVTIVRKSGKTPNGNLVDLVYTPPFLRKKGYATESVAHLSKRLLDEGNKFCFLFTDLLNPISNSIYQKIGYKPIIDVDQYEFIRI